MPDTTTKQDHLTPPTYKDYKWAEELWLAESGFENASQCKIFMPPDSEKQVSNVLKVVFENDSASSIKLTAFDNSSQDSTDEQLFNEIPWLKAIETTDELQPEQNWIGFTAVSNNATTSNALKGDIYNITCATIAAANDSKSFALACSLPSNATTIEHNWSFSTKYSYN